MTLYLDGKKIPERLDDNIEHIYGDGNDARVVWETSDADAHYLNVVVGTSRNIIISEDRNIDWGLAASANPQLVIQSADSATTAQRIRAFHNQADASIVSDTGAFIIDAPDGILLRDSTITALSATSDGTNATWSAVAADNIIITTTTSGNLTLNSAGGDFSVILQNRTITAGATHEAVIISPTWTAEDQEHTSTLITATQNGANASNVSALRLGATKATLATTLNQMNALVVQTPSVTGTVTNLYGIFIEDQSTAGGTLSFGIHIASQTANATTTRAINIAGTGVNNAIRLGNSPNIYSSAAEVIRLTDSTDGGGLSFTLTAAGDQTINTIDTFDTAIILQNQTFTAGAAHEAVLITPTWVAENFNHFALTITATQNGANSATLAGIQIGATKATGATTLATLNNIQINAPSVTGTLTNSRGIFIGDMSPVGGTTSDAILIASQSTNAVGTSAIRIQGTGEDNAIVLGNSPLIYSSAANNITFADSTNTSGLSLDTIATNIITLDDTDSVTFQSQPLTPGATHDAVTILPSWTAENFQHAALNVTGTQNGANTNALIGMTLNMVKATVATTLGTMFGVSIEDVTVTGTVTTSYGLIFGNQSPSGGTTSSAIVITSQSANATTTRAMMIDGTGVNNAIRLGGSPNIYASAANTTRLTDATDANGFVFATPATALQEIRTVSTTTGSIVFQSQTFTAGATHNAVQITPTWATENFGHTALLVQPVQNGANTIDLQGIDITLTKATGATTLEAVRGIRINAPVVTGTLNNSIGIAIGDMSPVGGTASYALQIVSQTANATTTRAIQIAGTGVNNAIRLGNSPNIYSSAAEVIRFADSTNARGIDFALTAAGVQTIGSTAGNLTFLQPAVGNAAFAFGNNAGARTVALVPVTFNGTAGAVAGGTLFDIDVSQTGAANPLFDIDVTALYGGSIFDVLIGAFAYDQTVLFLDLGATSTAGELISLSAGAASRTTDLVSINDSGIGAGNAIDVQKMGGSYSDGTGYVNIRRSGNFTGVATETAIDFSISAGFTLTEPAAGTFNYYGASIDFSGLLVTAGIGTTLVSALILTASADGDIGRSRALVLGGSNSQNSIQFGTATTAPIIYSSGAEAIVFEDSSEGGGGLTFTLEAAGNQTINTLNAIDDVIQFQNQTFTPGATHNAVIISPTWTAENFAHTGLRLVATQNGANSSTVTALELVPTKATAVTTLTQLNGLVISTSITGTVTDMSGIRIGQISSPGGTTSYGINILSQTANATTTRAIEIAGTGVNNAIRLGASPNMYSSAANVIRFSDATDARNIVFTLTAAGTQTIGTSAGSLTISPTTDTIFTDATGVVIGYSAQVSTLRNYEFQIQGIGTEDAGMSILGYGISTEVTLARTASVTPGTVGSVVTNGDILGILTFIGDDGTAVDGGARAADILGYVDGVPAANNVPGRIVFRTAQAGTLTEVFRVNSAGNLVTAVNADVNMSAGGRIYGGGIQANKQDLAANTNLTLDENDSVVNVTTGAVSVNTVTLPAASGNEGMIVSVYLVTDGGQNANVVRAGADVIQNGSADLANTQVALDDAGDYVMLQCVNSTMWQILVNSGGTIT